MSGPMATCAEVLSEFTHDLRPGAIPREVRENVSLRVLDILGIALASTAQDFAPAVLGLVEAWGSGECTVIGTKLRAAPPMAILANGSLAHGLDYDDTHTVAICHASAVVVPTALALGESLGLDGAAVLAAMVAGYETMTRIGMAAPGEFHARGWHATAVCGTFAAALVAGKCLGLSRAPLTAAPGVAGRPPPPGGGGPGGARAAGLAGAGFPGPATILEGRFGLYRTFLGSLPDPSPVTADLGRRWETLRVAFKPYPGSHN